MSATSPPRHCPACQAELRIPHPTMARLARRVRLASIALAFPWVFVGGFALWKLGESGLGFSSEIELLVLCAPLVAGLGLAYRYPRVLDLQCYRCGWRQEFRLGQGVTTDSSRTPRTRG